jgi:CDP-diacylglycerol--serine O-phosphatidyltransferase
MIANTMRVRREKFSEAVRRRNLKKGLYLIPSLFTAANIGMGFYAVMQTMHGFQLVGIGGEENLVHAAQYFDFAARALGWAVLFDSLDGRIARMTKTTTEIGVQLDSIADMLTFGIAPAALIYAWSYGSVFPENSTIHKIGWFISFMLVVCGAFRLARFNVQAMRPRVLAEGATKVDKKSFVGLPIPAAAGLLAAIVHFSPAPLISKNPEQSVNYGFLMMILVAALSALMVSTFRYTSFKSVGQSRRSTRFALVALAAFVMLVWLFSREVLLIGAIAYVSHGVLLYLASLFRRKPQ